MSEFVYPTRELLGTHGLYATDGRNGLYYRLPAIVTVTPESHPGDYADGKRNPLPVPDPGHVHLTVFSPGGFGTEVESSRNEGVYIEHPHDEDFVGAPALIPGSGTYVEWNVPVSLSGDPRTFEPEVWLNE